MGSNISQNGELAENPVQKIEGGSEPSTPILTNKVLKHINEELDPRSPSNSISRTPIQFLSTPEGDPKKTTPNLVDKLKTLPGELDPRSPSTDFTRTPILVANDEEKSKIPRKICNKNLEVVRRTGIVTTPNRRPKSTSNLPVVGPKLLESSPVSPKSVKSKRKSFVGLLETNIDYTETDLDEVLKMKYQSPKNNILESNEDPGLENIDPRSPTLDFARTPLQIVKKIAKIDLNDEKIVEKDLENSNDGSDIELQAPVDNKIVDKELENNSEIKEMEKTVENVEKSDTDDSLNQIPTELKTINDNKLTDTAVNQTKIVDLTHDVREFDKKLTNLIYEDTTILQTPPRKVQNLPKEGTRTPLKTRNQERNTYNSDPMKKTINKLKVSDRPRKSEISKIPVFKEKGRRMEEVQCENTPPRQLRERKRMQPIKSQWDTADKTLII